MTDDARSKSQTEQEWVEQFDEEKTLWSLPDCPRCGTQMESFSGHEENVDQCPGCGFDPEMYRDES